MKSLPPLLMITCLLYSTCSTDRHDLEVTNLRCEFMDHPLGLENSRPGLSWEIHTDHRQTIQAAYQLLVASSPELLEEESADMWSPGLVASGQSVQVTYQGRSLASASRYYWKVRIRDRHGVYSPWSEVSYFETGLLSAGDWLAEWIHAPAMGKGACPWFRKSFELRSLPGRATAFVGSAGFHELYVNGRKVSDAVLTPSVSDLRKRARYLTYDITDFLHPGKNAIAIWLAPGWTQFREFNPPADLGQEGEPLCIAQVHFDGAPEILSDNTWRCAPSHTWHLGKWQNGDFGGDSVNENLAVKDWNGADFDDGKWAFAETLDPGLALSSDYIEPNRMVNRVPARSITKIAPGKYQVAMAKLFTGWIEVKVAGQQGTSVSIMASAHPDKEVEFNQRNVYVIGPAGQGTFRNRFSYHEIGYVTLSGLDHEPGTGDVVGYQVSNDRAPVGSFDCSDTLLRQIYDITLYNYDNLSTGGMSVDCPHRERLGYGGDGHGSLEIALDARASHPFFSKWAQDWIDIQDDNGRINHTAPTLGGGGGPAWSGFILTMPWEVYESYGDRGILERVFPSAVRWLEYLARQVRKDGLLGPPSPGHWKYVQGNRWLFLGDWATPHGSEESDTPEASLFNNCYYVHVLKLAAKMAVILGKEEKAGSFIEQAERISRAINEKFFDPVTNTYLDTRQTHCIMPMMAGVVPEDHMQEVMANLEREVLVNRDGHFDTGIHGTFYLVKYLTERGRSDLIHVLASQTTFPSYGFFIRQGYVTWPEYWHECNSLMHGCLNGIGGWFQRGLAGIRPATPGYGQVLIKPAFLDGLEWVSAYHDSPYGRVSCSWKKLEGHLEVKIRVPANATATVHIPAEDANDVMEGKRPAAKAEGVQFLCEEGGNAVFRIGSGDYFFTIPKYQEK
jgi:alpha-L-rhamnosidase